MKRSSLTGVALTALLSACGGGGGSAGSTAPAPPAASEPAPAPGYAFIAPKAGAHLVYGEQAADTLSNTLNRTVTDDVTAVNPDGSYAVHEEDPSHNRIVSGTVDQTLYPTDFQYNAAGQATSFVADQGGVRTQCTIAGSEGAPAALAVGGTWNTTYTQNCGGPGVTYTQTGTLAGKEAITIAAGTFSAWKFVSTTTSTANGVTRTETATRWRDASGGDTRTLKMVRSYAYSGGTPAAGAPVSGTRELQSAR